MNSKILMAAAAAALAVSLSTNGAKASSLVYFSLSGGGGPTVTFELPLSPTPNAFDANSFTIDSVPTTINSLTSPETIEFDLPAYSGAFKVSSLYLVGPQIFTGLVYEPQFVKGIFAITDYDFGLGGVAFNQTLTIADANPTPLPSTWVMMLSGLVGVGFLAYRRTKKNAAAIAV